MFFRCAKLHYAAVPNSSTSLNGPVIPFRWEDDSSFVWLKPQQPAALDADAPDGSGAAASSGSASCTALEASSVQDSLLLMKFFSLSSAVSSALCWCKDGSKLELLFKLNDEETRIVEYGW